MLMNWKLYFMYRWFSSIVNILKIMTKIHMHLWTVFFFIHVVLSLCTTSQDTCWYKRSILIYQMKTIADCNAMHDELSVYLSPYIYRIKMIFIYLSLSVDKLLWVFVTCRSLCPLWTVSWFKYQCCVIRGFDNDEIMLIMHNWVI